MPGSIISGISQQTEHSGSSTNTNAQTVTHLRSNATVEGGVTSVPSGFAAHVSTEAQGAATGTRASAVTGSDDAGFSISFSIPIRGGLNAGLAAPQDL